METDRMFTIVIFVIISLSFQHIQASKISKRDYAESAVLRNGELNDPCRYKDDCGNFGYICASNKTCQCTEEFLPNYILKVCLGGVDQKCQYDEHCIDGAFCMNQSTCQCKDRLPKPSLDGLKCTSATSTRSLSTLLIAVYSFIFLILAT